MHLIHRRDRDGGWERRPVSEEGAALLLADGGGVEIVSGRDPRAVAHVVPFVEGDREAGALVARRSLRSIFVDGLPPLGVAVLEEHSELVLGDARLYFTTRERLVVAPYDGDPADCSVCGGSLAGAHVIVCGGCGAVTHEGALPDGSERLCFTHRGCCPGCRLRREDFAWMPPEDD